MDFETVSAGDFGRALEGVGINLLTRDILAKVHFLETLFGMTAHQTTADFAIMTYRGSVFQIHADTTFAGHPQYGLLPEAGARGAGAGFYVFNSDPDLVVAKVHDVEGASILQDPQDKPHGLREAAILDPEGYVWLPAKRIFND